MFLGEYQHSLDAKGRVILPAKFRDQLADGAFVTKGLDGCLAVYTREEFEKVADRVREQSKRGPKELDAARVVLQRRRRDPARQAGARRDPATLREFAGLERDVMVVGVDNRIEIWNRGAGGASSTGIRAAAGARPSPTTCPTSGI